MEKREQSGKRAAVPELPGTEEAGAIADALDPANSEERQRLIAQISSIAMYSAVPLPVILEGYEKAVPGGGKWLLEYTKAEQHHRHQLERKQAAYFWWGQIFGFVLGLLGLGGGIYLAANGAEWFGFAAFFGTLVSLVGLFVYNRKQKDEKNEAE